MRTTLDIEEDVLQAAKELARQRRTTAGRVLSELARRGLTAPEPRAKPSGRVRHGVPVVPSRGETVTAEKVRQLMDQEGV